MMQATRFSGRLRLAAATTTTAVQRRALNGAGARLRLLATTGGQRPASASKRWLATAASAPVNSTASAAASASSSSGGANASTSGGADHATGGGAAAVDTTAADEAFRTKLLDTALTKVADFGWTVDAIRAAAEALGYSGATHGVCTRGAYDLVDHWMVQQNDRALALVQAMPVAAMSTVDVLRAAVRTRLEANLPVLATWPQAMAVGAQPQHVLATLARLNEYVHRVWALAGDRSTDLNWYLKRTLLLGVYTSTELYFLTDRSHGYADTWSFLQRRLEDSLAVAAAPTHIGAFASEVGRFVWSNVSPPNAATVNATASTASTAAAADASGTADPATAAAAVGKR